MRKDDARQLDHATLEAMACKASLYPTVGLAWRNALSISNLPKYAVL
jgi:hypothetical protein